MIKEGFFFEKDSLTPQEWKKFLDWCNRENLTEKEAVLSLILEKLKQEETPIGTQILKQAFKALKTKV